ncbi:nuclear transport factor 2 family protein [Nocardia sp. NPDC051570]|uniref:nuclear transport factor 2 family protein n=1 Tax=Nocardia sp. NPDC051570 TaxID=3364324 RepID=UPI00379601DA
MTTNATVKTEIIEQIDHSLRALDERKFDELRSHFTEDVAAEYPIGHVHGIEQLLASTEAGVLRYARTQHLGLNYLVDIAPDGERATAGWNQICHHVHPEGDVFTVGTHCQAELIRTTVGWQVNHTTMQAIWTTGRPPAIVEV